MTQDENAGLTHFDAAGNAAMVDVTGKAVTHRAAVAEGEIRVSQAVLAAIRSGTAKKGDVLGVARIAGIMAAKNAAGLIPLCHPLPLERCAVDFTVVESPSLVRCRCTAETTGRTGVEMEALAGVGVALLTIYDMCKALDRGMVIGGIRLLEKSGGRSGHYRAEGVDA